MAGEPRSLVVPPAAQGKRLDAFVAGALEATSRTEVQRWIALGAVTLEGRPRRASEKVRAGDVVVVTPLEPERSAALPSPGVPFDVLFVDEALLVLHKPAGVVVHPGPGHPEGTLVQGLLARGLFDASPAALADARDARGYLRPGIVHRLDRGTSGVMVVARTAVARESLKAQFSEHSIERAYDAIAVGKVERLRHDTLHGRHPKDRVRFTTHVRDGKRAVTHVDVLERFGGLATLVRCRLETGRTHQIRVHLSETGTPILGDPLYGKTPGVPLLSDLARALGHQALHARVLGFVHPLRGKTMRFEVEPPEEFLAARDALRRARDDAGGGTRGR